MGGNVEAKLPVQQRAGDPLPTHPAAKAKMSKLELVEKFKLAAELNGVSWADLVVPCFPTTQELFSFSWGV